MDYVKTGAFLLILIAAGVALRRFPKLSCALGLLLDVAMCAILAFSERAFHAFAPPALVFIALNSLIALMVLFSGSRRSYIGRSALFLVAVLEGLVLSGLLYNALLQGVFPDFPQLRRILMIVGAIVLVNPLNEGKYYLVRRFEYPFGTSGDE